MDQFGSLIKGALGGWDRLRFHASLRPLFSPQWMRTYLCAAKVRLVDFAQHAQDLAHRLLQEAQGLAAAAGRPYHFLRSSQTSKEKFIEDIAQRDQVHSGLIAVLGAVGRKLRLLRAQGLIRKLPHTHRYLVTDSGRTILTPLVAAQQASTQKLTLALAA